MHTTQIGDGELKCQKCGRPLAISTSPVNRGQVTKCKHCRQNAWIKKNQTHVRTLLRRNYLKHRQANIRKAKAWRNANRERHRLSVWKSKLRAKNCTYERWLELVEEQRNRCALCGREGNGRRLDVDHDHRRKLPRGLLCNPCNYLVGQFEAMRKQIPQIESYLQHYEEKQCPQSRRT